MSLANIKLSNFTYRKASGDTSTRSVVVLEEGTDRIMAVEIANGDLTAVQPYLAYLAELEDLKEHLKAKHGLDDMKLPFKSFLNAGISAQTTTTLTIDL